MPCITQNQLCATSHSFLMSTRVVDTVEAIYCDHFGTDYINQMITLSQKPLALEK